MKKIREVLESTVIMWLPVIALAVANWLSSVVTVDMVMAGVKVLGLVSLITVIAIDIRSKK